jgi:hypothetical protein
VLFLEDVVNTATLENVASLTFQYTFGEFDGSATHSTEEGAEQYESLKLILKARNKFAEI